MKKRHRLIIPNKPTGYLGHEREQTAYMAHCPYCSPNQKEPNITVYEKESSCPICERDLIIDKVISPTNYILEAMNDIKNAVMQFKAVNGASETVKEARPITEFYNHPYAKAIGYIVALGAGIAGILSYFYG